MLCFSALLTLLLLVEKEILALSEKINTSFEKINHTFVGKGQLNKMLSKTGFCYTVQFSATLSASPRVQPALDLSRTYKALKINLIFNLLAI